MKVFWRKLREYRRREERSQYWLAKFLQRGQATVSRGERYGRPIPNREIVLKFCDKLALSSIETEKLLALAGYAPTSKFTEAMVYYLRASRPSRHIVFTRKEVAEILGYSLEVLQPTIRRSS